MKSGLKRPITAGDLYRPGLEMAGYFNYHPRERIQMLGKTEVTFMEMLTTGVRTKSGRAIMFTGGNTLYYRDKRTGCSRLSCLEEATKRDLPVLRSQMSTTIFASRLTGFLENKLAPSTTIHGVLVDVYGIGMLITGSSGIGKSETALELVKRGHRLIADDAVEIVKMEIRC